MAALVISSCGGSGDTPDEPEEKAPTSMTVTPASYTAEQSGGSFTISVTAPARPTAVSDQSWVTVTDGTYSNYSISYPVSVATNETYEERSATITVKSGSFTQTVTVNQAAKEKEPDPGDDPPTPDDNAAWTMAKKLGLGWNMGNQLEANDNGVADETCWGNPKATQATFNGVKAKSFKTVRIPVTWSGHIGDAPDYTIETAWMDRVYEVVGYAESAGLNVIINMHHDGADDKYWLNLKNAVASSAVNTQIKAEIKAVWTQIANKFKEKGDFLIMESFNEIHDGGWGWSTSYQTAAGKAAQNKILNEWNQVFVDAVRATGGNNSTRWLGVPGYAADPGFTLNDGFTLPSDIAGKVMVAFHDYTPYKFCQTGEDNEWGHTRKTNLNDSAYGEDYMKSTFAQFYSKYVEKGVPVYVGEFGCANRSNATARKFQLYWLEYFSKCAVTYGMSGFIWDNGARGSGSETYGIIDHGTGEYLDSSYGPQIVKACTDGFYTESAAYTLETVYNSAP